MRWPVEIALDFYKITNATFKTKFCRAAFVIMAFLDLFLVIFNQTILIHICPVNLVHSLSHNHSLTNGKDKLRKSKRREF